MTIVSRVIASLTVFARATALAATVVTVALPAPLQAEKAAPQLAETFGTAKDGEPGLRVKCGYILKKAEKYTASMVRVEAFTDPVDCSAHFKPKNPVIVRPFSPDTPDKQVKDSVAKSANSGGA